MTTRGPIVFLDKDGTVVEDAPGDVDARRMRLTPGAVEGLSMLSGAGYRLVVVTNQSGVAHGWFPESALTTVARCLRECLAARSRLCPAKGDAVDGARLLLQFSLELSA